MATKWSLKHCPTIIIIAICCTGLFQQVIQVRNRYFEYKTNTKVNLFTPAEIQFPWLSICFRYHDILNRAMIESNFGIKLKKWTDPGYDSIEFYEQTKNYLIYDIFKYSPAENEIFDPLKGCQIRYPGKFTMDTLNVSNCYSSFSIQKYLIRENVCYLFKPNITNEPLKIYDYKLSPGYIAQLYIVYLNTKLFNDFDSLHVAISYNKSDFLVDQIFSGNVELRTTFPTKIYVNYREFDRIRLPPPYDTQCAMPPPGHSSWDSYALHKINNDSMTLYNYSIPFAPTFDSSLHMKKIINYHAFYNETIRNQFKNQLDEPIAAASSCHLQYFVTDATYMFRNESAFSIFWPQDEKITFRYDADQEVIDFIIYICSSIGIWFGWSAYSLLNMIPSCFKWKTNHSNENISTQLVIPPDMIRLQNTKIYSLQQKISLLQRFNEELFEIVRS